MPGDDRWARILDGVAEFIENAPAEEILEDARLDGHDPELLAEQVRSTLEQAVISHQQAKFAKSRRDYGAETRRLTQRVYKLPRSPAKRRSLLQVLCGREGRITLQNRDITELTDEDVAVQLRSLAELGLMDDLDTTDGDE